MNREWQDWLRLARWLGIQTRYTDASGKVRNISLEAIRAAVVLFDPGTADQHPRQRLELLLRNHAETLADPVAVIWDSRARHVNLRTPRAHAGVEGGARLHLEEGSTMTLPWETHPVRKWKCGGREFVESRLRLPGGIPFGYHWLDVEVGNQKRRICLVAAPQKSYAPRRSEKAWGLFAPVYGLHSARSWGAGDISDWQRLIDWAAYQGAKVISTLPMMAAFLDEPFEPSPYSPASRLFWNEFFVDVSALPEFAACRNAQRLAGSREITEKLMTFRKSPLVDYAAEMKLRRAVLEELAAFFFSKPSSERDEFELLLKHQPEWRRYAAFRAAQESLQRPWREWPASLRQGQLRREHTPENSVRYHLYAQWAVFRQLRRLVERCRQAEMCLYLDLPLGVNPNSFDCWREQKLFVHDASVGAPPDLFFTKGQDWGFPPLHPAALRESGYRYLRAVLQTQMQFAGLLRIDHVMSLHRLYWIPQGRPASEGVYVRYPAEEWYAVLSLESHRHRTQIVGENLGTVPPKVNQALARHGVRTLFVLQYEARPDRRVPINKPPALSVASLNTHDMPAFHNFWTAGDVPDRLQMGLLSPTEARTETRRRARLRSALLSFFRKQKWIGSSDAPAAALAAALRFLGESDAQWVLVSLEDLWLETAPQNTPGTSHERPNWRRRLKFSLEAIFRSNPIARLLRQLHRARSDHANIHSPARDCAGEAPRSFQKKRRVSSAPPQPRSKAARPRPTKNAIARKQLLIRHR
jgi:4-alpha-glucanotransferase